MFSKLKASIVGVVAAASLALVPMMAKADTIIIIICDAVGCLIIIIN